MLSASLDVRQGQAVTGDMGLDSLQGRRDKAKLKWWYKVATMPEHQYSRKLFVQEWNVKPRRGRQRKYWCKVVFFTGP